MELIENILNSQFRLLFIVSAVLVADTVITLALVYSDIRRFRRNLKPGNLARVKLKKHMVYAKFLYRAGKMYVFKAIVSGQEIHTVPSNIYLP